MPSHAPTAQSEAKHTPGPWKVWKSVDPHTGKRGLICNPEGTLCVAEIVGRIRGPENIYAKEADANARLIAAAPDLLAACKEEVEWFDNLVRTAHPDDKALNAERIRIHGPRIERARAAIALAEGGAA